MRRALARALGAALLLLPLCAAGEGLRRLAVIAGNDDGGEGTRPLLYAQEDARRIHGILLRLGGVRPEDAALVLGGTAADLDAALARMDGIARQAASHGERTVLLVYYSGHAKDGALRLGSTRLPLESLKARLARSPADVRIGIFDACRSGVLTRTKGARRAPAFEIESDAGQGARGLVLLTSSAADEDSQEADPIHGSYFSHHLASGLLGDADRSGDGRVSLAEAYAYAYARTVADTSESAAGAQHPTFSYDLSGNGDLVLTDVKARTEGVLFPAQAPAGVYYLVDARGFVAAEVYKEPLVERRLAVPPGTYRVKRRLPDRLRVGELTVAAGGVVALDEARLKDAPFSDDPVKGGITLSRELPTRYSLALAGNYQAFLDARTRSSLFPPAPMLGAELALRNFFRRDWAWGFDLGLGSANGAVTVFGSTVPFRFSELTLGSSLQAEWPSGNVVPFIGARLALLILGRQFPDGSARPQSFATWSPGLVAGVRYRLTDNLGLMARGRLHYVLYNVDVEETRSLGYWELGGLITYDL